ncbi:hypothetical protein U9M48_017027 [Paspalum notatum var. saurae]|uniref:Magnesium transporter n=1 Tax=Paspalum notatum var. saurae TaxID=547442 RepID=A0AAQ3WNF8_PASNO
MERKQPPPSAAMRRKSAAGCRKWLVVPAAGEPREAVLGKHRITELTGLRTRDLRVLDPDLGSPSTILCRERAVVVNLEHIKAAITANEALVLHYTNPLLDLFIKDLRARLASSDISSTSSATACRSCEGIGPEVALCRAGSVKIPPFEFKVFEVCLEHMCKCFESETLALDREAHQALEDLTSKVSRLNLDRVRQIKNRLLVLSRRVQNVRDELERLLDDDIDVSEMYLTRKLSFQGLTETDHSERKEDDRDDETETGRESSTYVKPDVEELEILLEAYFMQTDGTLNKLYALREYVDDTEDYINLMLDEKQNQLLQMGVLLTMATVVVTAGIVVVSLFGMNIHIDLMKDPETDEQARIKNMKFWETTCGTVAGCLAMYLLAIYAGKRSNILWPKHH